MDQDTEDRPPGRGEHGRRAEAGRGAGARAAGARTAGTRGRGGPAGGGRARGGLVGGRDRGERGRRVADPVGEPDGRATRQRILDVALDLFTDHGYETTSLRQIAERMGFTKAALYYHFASKEDILLALHQRLHDVGFGALQEIDVEGVADTVPGQVRQWYRLLDTMIGDIVANRRLFELHERNRAALERLHSEHHELQHDDLQEHVRRFLADPALPVDHRVRMSSALGVIFGNLFMVGDALGDLPVEETGRALRRVLRDVLRVDEHGEPRPGDPAAGDVAMADAGPPAT